MIRNRLVAGIVAGVALVSLAACGSDSKSSDTTAKAATTTEKAATTTEKTDAGSATTDDSATDDTELHGDCVALSKEFEDAFGSASLDSLDPDTMKDVFEKMKTKVPSDLEDDVQTLEDAILPFAQAVKDAGGDMTKAAQDPAVQQAMSAMNSADVQAASANLQKWTSDGCPS